MMQSGLRTGRPRAQRRPRSVLIVGSGAVADRISTQLQETGRVEVVGYVDDAPKDPERCLGRLAELADVCGRLRVDDVLVALSRSDGEETIDALPVLRGRPRIVPAHPLVVVPSLYVVLPQTPGAGEVHRAPPDIATDPRPAAQLQSTAKRVVDVVGATIALVACLPLLAAAALAIRVSSRGPVLFRQARIGLHGKEFSMLKLRSMVVDATTVRGEAGGESVVGPFPKLKDDPRVTRVGRVVRRFSIDELPQLWNVLRGEMSLVGPRPFVPDDAAVIDGWARGRHAVRPGVTGLWQVAGRNDLTFDDMCRLDHLYVHCWSIGVDLRILLRTAGAVVRRRGAY